MYIKNIQSINSPSVVAYEGRNGKLGIIDNIYEHDVDHIYSIRANSSYLILFRNDEKYGYLNQNGSKIVIEPILDFASNLFVDGITTFYKNGNIMTRYDEETKVGYLDAEGKVIWEVE